MSELEGLTAEDIAEICRELVAQTPQSERRGAPRRSFRAGQWVAPYVDARVPCTWEFCEVPCLDISTQGIGFIWPTKPDFRHVVVGLGKPPELTYLSARVVNFRPCPDQSDTFRVGCQFLGRVVPPS